MRKYAHLLAVAAALCFRASSGHADPIDTWCAKASKPDNVVICADPELRHMTADRNTVLSDAQQRLSVEAYQTLRDDEARWVKSYTAECGIAADGPPPTRPIAQAVIDCYMRAGAQRLAYLVQTLGRQIPDYRPSVAVPDSATLRKMAEQSAREHEAQLAGKLKERGYAYKTPEDFEIDWRELYRGGSKVAVRGYYYQDDDVEWLSVENKDQRIIRLYTDNASREARKTLLECRNNGTPCPVIVGAVATTYVENKGSLNEKPVGALEVRDVFPQ